MAHESASFLAVREVIKKVRDGRSRRTIVDGVSFELDRKTMAVIRGASGSGKTTLLAIVGAMLAPTSGEVWIDGEATSRIRDAHRAAVRRRKVGFVFQDVQLIDAMSVIDNVVLPAVPDGVDGAIEKRAHDLLERFGVASLAKSEARSLSGGERQRVALARALLFDAPLLLLDEPTAHLDDERAGSVMKDLAALAAEGRAVIVATHDARVLASAKDARAFDMTDGKLEPATPS
jgi:ABC-type lipoprotein export system ATPase subunit